MLLVAGAPAWAAAPEAQGAQLTLAAAMDEALLRSPEVQEAEAAHRQSLAQRHRVQASFLPQLQLFATHQFAARFYQMALGNTPTDTVVSLKSPLSELGGQLSLPLFDGMQNIYRLQAAGRHVQASDKALGWVRFRLQREVRLAFRQVLAGQLIELAARQDLDTLVSHQSQVTSLRRQGAATDFDVLRVDVQLQNARVGLLQAQDRTYLARRRLAQVMGLEDDTRPLAGEMPRPEPGQTARVQALGGVPSFARLDLAAMERREAALDKLRAASKSFWIPKVDFGATLTTYNMWDKELGHAGLFKRFDSVSVRLRWNIFDGLESLAEAEEQGSLRDQMRHRRHAAQLKQAYHLVEGKKDYLLAVEMLAAREMNVRRAEENLRLARAGLQNGSRDSTDVLDAEQDLFGSRAGAIEALLHIEEAAVHLDMALGTAL